MSQQLCFPIKPDGLWVPVLIGHESAFLQALQAAGRPLPSPVHCRGLIDTGTDVTCVVPRVLTTLGLRPSTNLRTQTAGGPIRVNLFDVSLTIYDPAAPPGSFLVRPQWSVTDLPQDLPMVDVLIGLDLIRQIYLNIEGPSGHFTLSF